MGAQKGVERVTQVRDLHTGPAAASVSGWPWPPPTVAAGKGEHGGVNQPGLCPWADGGQAWEHLGDELGLLPPIPLRKCGVSALLP